MSSKSSTQSNPNLEKLCNKYNDAVSKKKSVTIISNLEKQILLEYMRQKK